MSAETRAAARRPFLFFFYLYPNNAFSTPTNSYDKPYTVNTVTQEEPNKVAEVEPKQRPFVDLIVSIIIPSIILMKLSGEDKLGPVVALIVALAFPICWGLYELIGNRKRNYIALLGIFSVLLTGGIGLLKIDAQWLAVKEAAIPLILGIGVLVANKMGFPIVRKLLFNPKLMNVDRVESALAENNNKPEFETKLDRANLFFAGTFLFSAIMNYVLAKVIVTSESGSAAFNEELGKMTLLSYPMIAIPSTIMMLAIFYFIWRTVNRLTGLKLEEVLVGDANDKKNTDK